MRPSQFIPSFLAKLEERGMTVAEFEKSANFEAGSIQALIDGPDDPTPNRNVKLLADRLGIDPRELFPEEPI